MVFRSFFGAALSSITLAGLMVATAACSGNSSNEVDAGPSQANPLDAEESALLQQINDHRASNSITPVRQCATLNESASQHADDMRDKGYLDDAGQDGSKPRERACDAGYKTGCDQTAFAELVASGVEDASATLGQWTKATNTNDILLNPELGVAGIGRSLGGEVPYWAVDFGTLTEPSCD